MLEDIYPKVQSGPPKPSVILAPSVFSLPPGSERYVVPGCGAVLIAVEPGDQISVLNDEGGQLCEVLACDSDGVSDTGVLGCSATGDAHGLKGLLSSGNHSLSSVWVGFGVNLNFGKDKAQNTQEKENQKLKLN